MENERLKGGNLVVNCEQRKAEILTGKARPGGGGGVYEEEMLCFFGYK